MTRLIADGKGGPGTPEVPQGRLRVTANGATRCDYLRNSSALRVSHRKLYLDHVEENMDQKFFGLLLRLRVGHHRLTGNTGGGKRGLHDYPPSVFSSLALPANAKEVYSNKDTRQLQAWQVQHGVMVNGPHDNAREQLGDVHSGSSIVDQKTCLLCGNTAK